MRSLVLGVAALAVSCGGAKKGNAVEPGQDHAVVAGAPDAGPASAWGGGAPSGNSSGTEPAPSPPVPPPPPPGPPVTFELKNGGEGDLVFAIDQGWQPVLFAYSGKPPKAKSILLFPKGCTESCEAPPETMCPVCSESENSRERKKQEREQTKREIAAPGASVQVPWDGKVFEYVKAPPEAKRKRCQCWQKVDPPAETYTVKACGLRPATKPGQPTRPVCAEGTMTLPLATTPQTITLSFGK